MRCFRSRQVLFQLMFCVIFFSILQKLGAIVPRVLHEKEQMVPFFEDLGRKLISAPADGGPLVAHPAAFIAKIRLQGQRAANVVPPPGFRLVYYLYFDWTSEGCFLMHFDCKVLATHRENEARL